jgi:hypothetical protein
MGPYCDGVRTATWRGGRRPPMLQGRTARWPASADRRQDGAPVKCWCVTSLTGASSAAYTGRASCSNWIVTNRQLIAGCVLEDTMTRTGELRSRVIVQLLGGALCASILVTAPPDACGAVLDGWTSVGSAGTVDESSTADVRLTGPVVEMVRKCYAIGLLNIYCSTSTRPVTIRYNIVPSGALYSQRVNGEIPFVLYATLRAAGDAQQVLVTLHQVDLSNGVDTVMEILDSKAFPLAPTYHQLSVGYCNLFFHFDAYAYYIEARLLNSDARGVAPGLAAVHLEGCGGL